MKVLPQFADLVVPSREELSVLIQGFGAVGTHAAVMLTNEEPLTRITGISDYSGYLYDTDGLPIAELIEMQGRHGLVAYPYYCQNLSGDHQVSTTFANHSDDLLRESAFCLVPAAPIANYLDVDDTSNPTVTVDHMGDWKMIVEGANTYSPFKQKQAARRRMERSVYWQKGVLIATDFLVNSGGVIYAAQEQLIKPPPELLIPEEILGK